MHRLKNRCVPLARPHGIPTLARGNEKAGVWEREPPLTPDTPPPQQPPPFFTSQLGAG